MANDDLMPTEKLDELFEPTIEEAILASGGHTSGRMHTPEGGESIEDLLV
jgi:hypothetical protein